MKYAADRPFTDQKRLRAASSRSRTRSSRFRAASRSRKSTSPSCFAKGTPAEYGAGPKLAIEHGWLAMHDSGTFVAFTAAGAELFA
jgi:hypothetical protein